MTTKDTLKNPNRGLGRYASKTYTIICSLLLMVALFTTGCKKDDYDGEITGECPVVVSTDPKDKAVDVATNKQISATFNKNMDASTISKTTFILKQGSTLVSGTVAPTADGTTFTFNPDIALLPFTTYTGTITTGATDSLNTALESDYIWTFTTIPEVTLSSNPGISGFTSGDGKFNQGSLVTVTATPESGYVFANWTNNGTIVSTSFSYQFAMTGNNALVANFIPLVQGNFAVMLSSSPALGGITLESGSFSSGALVNISATPNAGYTFVNWTENGTIVSANSSYQFSLSKNRSLVANFILGSSGPVGLAPINLGSAADFGILTKSGISSTGTTKLNGNIGVSPAAATAITGFGLIMDASNQFAQTPIVNGKVYASNYAAPIPSKMTVAVNDMETAFTTANGLTTPAPIVGLYAGDISGRTLPAGLYKWSTGLLVSNAGVTLEGGANDVWVFQIAQDLTINNSAIITLKGGAQAKNIFWIVNGQATLGTNVNLSGIILSKTLISLNTGTKVTGKLLAQTAVTLNAATVTAP